MVMRKTIKLKLNQPRLEFVIIKRGKHLVVGKF